MSVATTVKLPPKLKKRIAPLARAAGKSDHAWMVDALASQVEREEQRQSFIAAAVESQTAVAEGEPVYAAEDVFAYLRAKVAGQKSRKPTPRKRAR
jgi:predicted transcriptional regulator